MPGGRFLLPALLLLGAAAPNGLDLGGLMAQVAQQPQRTARFVEEKRMTQLSVPLVSSGHLLFRRPLYLEQDTEQPRPERLVIDGATATITENGAAPHSVALSSSPVLQALADTLRAVLGGDLTTLRRLYAIQEQGPAAAWRLLLTPRETALRGVVARVTVDGSGAVVRQIDIQQWNGDEQRLTIVGGS